MNHKTLRGANTQNSPSHGKSTDQLVSQRLGLSDGAKSPRGDLLGVQLDIVVLEVETFLNDRSQLPDSPALLAQDALRVSGHEDDFCSLWGDANFHARVAIFGELTSQELVQLSLEDSVSNKLQMIWTDYYRRISFEINLPYFEENACDAENIFW